jgi:replicative DNA helicase
MATVPDITLDAGLPANVDAEKTILGAILLDNAAHSEAAEKIEADDFSLDSHRRIYLRMSQLLDSQRAVDIVTLANELARYKEVEAVGGVAYLASLTEPAGY